jgi:hypothetical protein
VRAAPTFPEDAKASMNTHVGAKDVTDQMRRDKFLIGVDLSPEAQTGVRNVLATLHRALRVRPFESERASVARI